VFVCVLFARRNKADRIDFNHYRLLSTASIITIVNKVATNVRRTATDG